MNISSKWSKLAEGVLGDKAGRHCQAKDISGFEGKYTITQNGEIWSYRRQRWLHSWADGLGYLYIKLGGKTRKIHRLLAMTFIPNPDNKPEVNHKDGNKSNIKLSNLEWVTRLENNQHAFDIGLKENARKASSRNGMANRILTQQEAFAVRKTYREGVSSIKLGKLYNVSKPTILNIIHYKSYKYGVFSKLSPKWRGLYLCLFGESSVSGHCHWCKFMQSDEGEVTCFNKDSPFCDGDRIRTWDGLERASKCKVFELADWYADDKNYEAYFKES